jgi:hypothetical protein
MPPSEPPGVAQILREFQPLLIAVAHGHTPDRGASMAYTRLRSQLLQAAGQAPVPGFVHQCLSIASFKTFIGLYHPQKAARQEFIEESFARLARPFDRRPARSVARHFDAF